MCRRGHFYLTVRKDGAHAFARVALSLTKFMYASSESSVQWVLEVPEAIWNDVVGHGRLARGQASRIGQRGASERASLPACLAGWLVGWHRPPLYLKPSDCPIICPIFDPFTLFHIFYHF